jgi:copper chaperone CopZ
MSVRTTHLTLRIEGMHCASCAMAIDMELEDLPGVEEARTSFARATTEVAFDPSRVRPDAVIAAIRDAGYTARPVT